MRESLERTARTIPYNSIAKLLIGEGKKVPKVFGGNCIEQNRALVHDLISKGFKGSVQFTAAHERPHWMTICTEGKTPYLLDPFFLHTEPINLARVMRGETIVSPAFPIKDRTANSFLQARAGEGRQIEVEFWNPGANGNGRLKRQLAYTFDPAVCFEQLPPATQKLGGAPLNRLELAVVRQDGGVSRMSQEVSSGGKKIALIGEKELVLNGDGGFEEELERIAKELRVKSNAIGLFFAAGMAAHRKNAAALTNTGA